MVFLLPPESRRALRRERERSPLIEEVHLSLLTELLPHDGPNERLRLRAAELETEELTRLAMGLPWWAGL